MIAGDDYRAIGVARLDRVEGLPPFGWIRAAALPRALRRVRGAAFFAELVTMFALAPDRARYLLLNPIDLAIVVLTPPFIGGAVQSIRALRLL